MVPRATPLGGSRGFNAHKPGKVHVYDADPHSNNRTPVLVDLSKLDEESVLEAYQSADGDDFGSIALATFRKLAEETSKPKEQDMSEEDVDTNEEAMETVGGAYVVPPAPRPVPKVPARRAATPPKAKPSVVDLARTSRSAQSPSAAFQAKKQASFTPTKTLVEAPSCRVTFEVEGIGEFESDYHQVVLGEDGLSLVLVYDNRFSGGLKFFPQASDHALLVDVHNMSEIFKAHSSGIRFSVGDLEMYVMLIEDRATKES